MAEINDVQPTYRVTDRIKATVVIQNSGDSAVDATPVTEIVHDGGPAFVYLVDLGGKTRENAEALREFGREVVRSGGLAYIDPNLAFPERCGPSQDKGRPASPLKPGDSFSFEMEFKRLDEERPGLLDVVFVGVKEKLPPGLYALQVVYRAHSYSLVPGAKEDLRSNTVEFEIVP